MDDSFFKQGAARHQAGDLRAAESLYRKAIKKRDRTDLATYNLALLYSETNRGRTAVPLLRKLIAKDKGNGRAHFTLGKLLLSEARVGDACRHLKMSVAADPTNMDATISLSDALVAARQFDDALATLEAWLETPRSESGKEHIAKHKTGEVFSAWGDQTDDLKLYRRAKDAYLQCLEQRPEFLPSLINLAHALTKVGEFQDAEQCAERAISMAPDASHLRMTLASALIGRDVAREKRAVEIYRNVVSQDPKNASAHWNLSHSLLRLGNYKEGWREYRWRNKREHDKTPVPSGPKWNGEETSDPLVVYTEQGFGDAIMCARFLHEAASRVGSLVLACEPKLQRLFGRLGGNFSIVTHEDYRESSNAKVSIMDLPDILNIAMERLSPEKSYLAPKTEPSERFKFLRDLREPRIGIVWSGSRSPDPLRSCPLQCFATLARQHELVFQSLLVGPEAAEITGDTALVVNDLSPFQEDFEDAASAIDELDLVITVDTAIAHLAGAMGKETWVLLPLRADWRWMFDRTDSAWYSSVRLFRQTEFNDWSDVFSDISLALNEWQSKRAVRLASTHSNRS